MKVKLIAPCRHDHLWKGKKTAFVFPPLALPLLAALTPPDVQVSLCDEVTQKIDWEEEVDLVGLSVMTATAPRAYQIARQFRARGTRVIMGGIHPSLLPDEARPFADSVAVGEAEELWPRIIEDAKKNALKPLYRASTLPSLQGSPSLRYDLLDRSRYLIPNVVQATRGCPYDCSFCSVTAFSGKTFRFRPVPEVIRDISSLPGRFFLFVDDNLIGSHAYGKELLSALIPLRRKWVSQASLTIAREEKLLDLAAEAGCIGLLIGFESLSQEILQEIGKRSNRAQEYRTLIRRIRSRGIGIQGSFVFGFDQDDPSVFARTAEFVEETRLDAANFCRLTPFPGTRLFARLQAEGRILHRSWEYYDREHVVFRPKRMSPEELDEGTFWAYERIYSLSSIAKRMPPNWRHPVFYFAVNLGYHYGVSRQRKASGRIQTTASNQQPLAESMEMKEEGLEA
ncbi:MAG: radical SAM protein [candidate division NC10 bacterium]|nr:radical SAM protein [candidate division NC10 bacterium]